MGYCVIRTDALHGTHAPEDLVSLRVYDADGNPIAVENGTIVELQGYEAGQREVQKAVLATASSDVAKCAIVASVEMMYDERMRNLDEYTNEANKICRGYIPRSRNLYSVTKEGFVGGTAPTETGAAVGIGDGGKLDAAGSGYGTLEEIEVVGRYTYYLIKIA